MVIEMKGWGMNEKDENVADAAAKNGRSKAAHRQAMGG